MFSLRYCFFFITLFVLSYSVPVPEVIQEPSQKFEPDFDLSVLPLPKVPEYIEPFNSETIAPSTPENPLVFKNPPSLCAQAVENMDPNCIEHCKNKGYEHGLCFNDSCNCA